MAYGRQITISVTDKADIRECGLSRKRGVPSHSQPSDWETGRWVSPKTWNPDERSPACAVSGGGVTEGRRGTRASHSCHMEGRSFPHLEGNMKRGN